MRIFSKYTCGKVFLGLSTNSLLKVMLATENLSKLSTEHGQLRWMFRLHDYDGDGKVPVAVLPKIIKSYLSFNTV